MTVQNSDNKMAGTLPKGFNLKWSTHQISFSMHFLILGYLTYYCTNRLEMAPAAVGVILLISKLFDGVTDVIAAVVIERTKSKMGKGRPYVLLMPVVWVLTVLIFSTPEFGQAGKAFFIFALYFMINSVGVTLVSAAEPVYLARSLKNPEDSAVVLSLSGFAATIAGIIGGIMIPLLITHFENGSMGWTWISLIFAVPGMILSFLRVALVKERDDILVETVSEKFGFKDMFKVLMDNRHVILLVVVQMLANVFSGLGTAVMTYYFQYIVGNINSQALVTAAGVVGMLVLVFMPQLFKRFSVKQVMLAFMLVGAVGCLLRMIPVVPVLMISSMMTYAAVIPTGMLMPSLLIDCMDYNEWKSGKRVEAVFGAMNSLASKVGSGMASVLAGVVMGLAGYDGSLAVQSAAANQSIIALYGWIPAIMFVIMFLLTRKYKIDEMMPQVRRELEERKGNASC